MPLPSQTENDRSNGHLAALTGARFVLAVWVVLLHLTSLHPGLLEVFPVALRGPVHAVIGSGAAAVGMFFLLSGFVLAYTYQARAGLSGHGWSGHGLSGQRRSRFWMARLARVYPVYLFALVVGLPSLFIGAHKTGQLHHASFVLDSLACLLLVQSWIPSAVLFWDGAAWSLSCEVLFYAVFPLLAGLLWKARRAVTLCAGIMGFWVLACVSALALAQWKHLPEFGAGPEPASSWSLFIQFNPLLRLPEFLAGILLCRLFLLCRERGVSSRQSQIAYWTGIAAILLTTSFSGHLPAFVLHNGLLLPATAAMMFGLANGGGWLAQQLSRPRIVLLGQASYTMYILHIPLLSYFEAAAKRLPTDSLWITLLLYVFSLTGLSVLVFRKLEEPARAAIMRAFGGGGKADRSAEVVPAAADPF